MKRTRRLAGNELAYVSEVLDAEFSGSRNPNFMSRLENAFADRFESKFAISFVNGTATLHATLEAFGVAPGDEVIVPPLTMSAPALAVLQANCTPVFADVDPYSFCINPESISERVTAKTKAIITVALFGLSPDMDPIMGVAKEHGLRVIEDNAQCFLGDYKGKLTGTMGDAASFSFQSSKHMTSGEGGMIVTDDEALADRIRTIQSLGYLALSAGAGKIDKRTIQDPGYARHGVLGWNYRIPELCAAVALAQLEELDRLVAQREYAAMQMLAAAADCEWLKAQTSPYDARNAYWTVVLRLDRDDIDFQRFRDKFREFGGDGIYAAWKLSYLEPLFQNLTMLGRDQFISEANRTHYKEGYCPVAERVAPRLLQFKTNYFDNDSLERQVQALQETIRYFT